MAREVREAAKTYGLDALISDDYLEVERAIGAAAPELVLGTQMERHIAKRLHVPCATISGPFHVQDVPARYSPQMGWEGANVLFDAWVHPLMMGLEEHLITMFSEDFEFDETGSHLGKGGGRREAGVGAARIAEDAGVVGRPSMEVPPATAAMTIGGGASGLADDVAAVAVATIAAGPSWSADGERELKKIPFFVRKKARLNTERFAADRGILTITVDTLYEAKAHYGK
jgi:light-independent protochlorophyllide reductase subunit B